MPTNDRYTEEPFYKDATVKDLPLKDMTEFRLMEDPDGVHIQLGEMQCLMQIFFQVSYDHSFGPTDEFFSQVRSGNGNYLNESVKPCTQSVIRSLVRWK